ncbi:MAG: CBS domain-containing protein [Tunicatimonas sp.]
MIARELINPLIPSLRENDDIAKATSLMDDLTVTQLPVVEDTDFRGFITSDMLFDDLFSHPTVGQYQLKAQDCFVRQDQHFYEIAKVLSDCDQSMVVVVDEQGEFAGVIDVSAMMSAFSKSSAVQSPGGIIELVVKHIDYSLAEITRLIEADGVKILGCFIRNDNDPTRIRVTMKLDKKDIARTVATLERFNYHVQALFQEELIDTYEKERLDALLRYLDI